MIKKWQDRVRPNASLGEQHPVMQAEIDELRAELAETRRQLDMTANASIKFCPERNAARIELAKVNAQEPEFATTPAITSVLSSIRFFGSLKWAEGRGTAREDLSDVSAAWVNVYEQVQKLAAGAQGHTREQIGLAQDNKREGLTAHHVYCRAVTEDV